MSVSYGVPGGTIRDKILNKITLNKCTFKCTPGPQYCDVRQYHLFCQKFCALSDNYLLHQDMFGMQLFGCSYH